MKEKQIPDLAVTGPDRQNYEEQKARVAEKKAKRLARMAKLAPFLRDGLMVALGAFGNYWFSRGSARDASVVEAGEKVTGAVEDFTEESRQAQKKQAQDANWDPESRPPAGANSQYNDNTE